MSKTCNRIPPAFLSLALGFALTVNAQQLSQPVYRVAGSPQPMASDVHVDPQVTPANAIRPAGLENSPFDIYEVRGEHPLMPCIRLAEQGLREFDQNIKGYSAILTKTERINGDEEGPQQIAIKVRHKPFGVHMVFLQPYAGREVLYNTARNPMKLVARAHDWKKRFGKVPLDVNGRMAMEGQRYPITMTGIEMLTKELLKVANADIKYAECSVRYSSSAKIDGRSVTMIEATHPIPRRNFRYHIARIFIDHELRIPTAYEAFSWPAQKGGKPILEERYIYTNVSLNPGFTDADFDENSPHLFK